MCHSRLSQPPAHKDKMADVIPKTKLFTKHHVSSSLTVFMTQGIFKNTTLIHNTSSSKSSWTLPFTTLVLKTESDACRVEIQATVMKPEWVPATA